MPQAELSVIEQVRLAALTEQFNRALEKNGAILRAVLRALKAPRGPIGRGSVKTMAI
jgi:hypothetical protein